MSQPQFVTCRLDELRTHPSYARLHLTVPACKLAALAPQGDLAYREPLVVTSDRVIIDGYARVELARQQGRPTLPCIAYELTEPEALGWLIQKHRRSNGLNDFVRILLALDLEPSIQQKARANQRAGGQFKGSSNLIEAGKVDVRSEIAAAAGVSVGNVSKVKQLAITAHPDILQALRKGEIRIHRAWLWSKESPENQQKALRLYQSTRGINKTIRSLLSQHRPAGQPTKPGPSVLAGLDVADVLRRVSELASSEPGLISVAVINAPAKGIFLTEELFQSIGRVFSLRIWVRERSGRC